jgi:ring-1,2-phenylacetyl-CoA epoxidase subunit PaaB
MYTYEVFLKPDGRDGFAHAGSLDAPDDELAMIYARETYIRRGEGAHAWVVRRESILVLDPADLQVTIERDRGVNDGSVLAARRGQQRVQQRSGEK